MKRAPKINELERVDTDLRESFQGVSVKDVKAAKCRKNYFFFLQEFWETIVHDPPVWNWHIPYLCQEMQEILERVHQRLPKEHDLIINIPPGTTKSIICTIFLVAWAWTRYPYMRFIKTSYSSPLSLEHADYIRDIVRSEKYQQYFPEIKLKADKSGKSNFKVVYQDKEHTDGAEIWRLGGGLLSTSINATATGFHAHCLITDDPIDPSKSVSEAEITGANRWLDQVLSNRVIDKRITPHMLIMQRTAKKDPSGVALEKAKKGKKIKHICLPGDILTIGNRKRVKPAFLTQFYDIQGGLLDPKRLDAQALKEQKLNLGQYGYKSQVDQNPTSPGSGMFDIGKISLIDPGTFNAPANIVRIVRYWDKAGTQDGGAFTVGLKMALLKYNRFLIMDLVRGQWGTHKREKMILETVENDGPSVLQCLEQEPGSGGKDSAVISKAAIQAKGAKCKLDRPTGDKIYRADPFSVAVGFGYVYMFKAPWNEEVKAELSDFPNSDYKDITDAGSGAYKELKAGKRAGTWGN